MLNDLLGFFVIEHHVQQTTEYIINSDNLQQMWNMSAEKLKAFSQSFLTLKQGLDLGQGNGPLDHTYIIK